MNKLQKDFEENGFVGPFDALSKQELNKVRAALEKILENNFYSPLYKRSSGRDWHLVHPDLLAMIRHPVVVERLRQLLSNDLIAWRSQIFDKEPKDGSLRWHQGYLFSGEEYGNNKHSLVPPNDAKFEDCFDITVWFAIDDATLANGAVKLAKGTHKKQYPVKKVRFLESSFGLTIKAYLERIKDFDRLEVLSKKMCNQLIFEPESEGVEVYNMEIKSGQFFIFNERTIHRSGPNNTDKRRLAINFRVTTPDVVVYPFRLDGNFTDGEEYDISRHGCFLISGEDRYKKNVIFSENPTFH